MHFICARHTKTIYVSKFQVNTVTNIEVIRQNVFSHARVMVIGVSSDLNYFSDYEFLMYNLIYDIVYNYI